MSLKERIDGKEGWVDRQLTKLAEHPRTARLVLVIVMGLVILGVVLGLMLMPR